MERRCAVGAEPRAVAAASRGCGLDTTGNGAAGEQAELCEENMMMRGCGDLDKVLRFVRAEKWRTLAAIENPQPPVVL